MPKLLGLKCNVINLGETTDIPSSDTGDIFTELTFLAFLCDGSHNFKFFSMCHLTFPVIVISSDFTRV